MSNVREQSLEELNVPLLRLVADTLLSHGPEVHRGMNIQTRRDEVTLRGVIVGEEARDEAVALVRSIVGVGAVVDRLTVRPKPQRPTALEVPVTVAVDNREPWWQRAATPLAFFGLIFGLVFWQYSVLNAETRLATLPVEGAVYFEGEPAVGAELTFHPLDVADSSVGKPHAEAGPDGRFRLQTYTTDDGAPPGHYVVTVRWSPPTDDVVPTRFTSPRTTPLFVKIAEGEKSVLLESFQLADAPSTTKKVL